MQVANRGYSLKTGFHLQVILKRLSIKLNRKIFCLQTQRIMKVPLCPWSDRPMWYGSSTRLEHFGGRLFFLLDLLFFLAPDSSVEVPLSVNFEDSASLGPSNCPGSGSPHTKGLCEFRWIMHNEWWRREKLGDQECWVLPSPNSHCPLKGDVAEGHCYPSVTEEEFVRCLKKFFLPKLNLHHLEHPPARSAESEITLCGQCLPSPTTLTSLDHSGTARVSKTQEM